MISIDQLTKEYWIPKDDIGDLWVAESIKVLKEYSKNCAAWLMCVPPQKENKRDILTQFFNQHDIKINLINNGHHVYIVFDKRSDVDYFKLMTIDYNFRIMDF